MKIGKCWLHLLFDSAQDELNILLILKFPNTKGMIVEFPCSNLQKPGKNTQASICAALKISLEYQL